MPKLRVKIETLKLLNRRVGDLIELSFLGCCARNLMSHVVVLIPLALEVRKHLGLTLGSSSVGLLIKRLTVLEKGSRKIS